MNRDDIIRMAQEAGLIEKLKTGGSIWYPDNLERFFHMAQAAEREAFAKHSVDIARRAIREEREACLKLCDAKQHYFGYQCAEAIRARGNQ